ncbi:MAG: PepSY domain-containing protein [Hyphomicrobiales bacterium]
MHRCLTILVLALAVLAGPPVEAHAGARVRMLLAQNADGAVIPPSAAVNQALSVVPDGTPLDVQLRGKNYLVKLKTGNKVRVVRVDAITGAVSP